MEKEINISKRLVFGVIFGVVALILAFAIGGNSFEDVPIGKYQVKQQWITGNKSAKMDPGVWLQFGTIFEFPTQGWNAITAVVDNVERTHLANLIGQIYGNITAGLVDLTIPLFAQAQEIASHRIRD